MILRQTILLEMTPKRLLPLQKWEITPANIVRKKALATILHYAGHGPFGSKNVGEESECMLRGDK